MRLLQNGRHSVLEILGTPYLILRLRNQLGMVSPELRNYGIMKRSMEWLIKRLIKV